MKRWIDFAKDVYAFLTAFDKWLSTRKSLYWDQMEDIRRRLKRFFDENAHTLGITNH